jgi:hypothetical protein
VLNFSVQGQESPYNAKAYFEAEHNRTYLSLVKKVETSEALSREEFKFLGEMGQTT